METCKQYCVSLIFRRSVQLYIFTLLETNMRIRFSIVSNWFKLQNMSKFTSYISKKFVTWLLIPWDINLRFKLKISLNSSYLHIMQDILEMWCIISARKLSGGCSFWTARWKAFRICSVMFISRFRWSMEVSKVRKVFLETQGNNTRCVGLGSFLLK